MDEFREAVRQMRSLQKQYFKTREHKTLNESKAAEKKVDEMLNEEKQGPKLF